jgi:hypothetical protein
MLGMLTAVLRFDRVTGERGMTRERHVALADSLGIGKIVASIPSRRLTLEALPITSRAPAACREDPSVTLRLQPVAVTRFFL